jgi:hypothetical protein
VMSSNTSKKGTEPERPVEQFFRSVERPSTPESRFTAQDVAAIVRRDRDAAK